jgi:hypothetical protein
MRETPSLGKKEGISWTSDSRHALTLNVRWALRAVGKSAQDTPALLTCRLQVLAELGNEESLTMQVAQT